MKTKLILALCLAASVAGAQLDDVRARLWLTNTLNAGHTGHTPQFTVRNGWNSNLMSELTARLSDVHPGLPVDVFTQIENANICRVKGCREARPVAGKVAVNLQWETDPRYNLAGFTLLQGTNPGSYSVTNFIGNITNVTASLLATNAINYFALRAEDVGGLKSPLSVEFFYDPSGNEYLRTFGVQESLFPLQTNALGVAYYVIKPPMNLIRNRLGWWLPVNRLTVPGADELRGLYP